MALRPELLHFPREDGGLDLLDLVLERLVSLSPAEAGALDAPDAALAAKLQALLLLEGPSAVAMRQSAWASRARGTPRVAPAQPVEDFDWEQARVLPELVAPTWRDPERLRRLAEDRAGGRRFLALPGFIEPGAAARLAEQAAALAFDRMDSPVVHAERHLLGAADVPEWRALMAAPELRRLLGVVLGVALPERVVINAWRMRAGDNMAVHPDGRLYCGTLSLGLSRGWRAADGGAIAFGAPTAAGLDVRERWWPHLGDALLFAPAHDTWHAVEPVQGPATRLSLTGWWSG
jgi:hypothetical protein